MHQRIQYIFSTYIIRYADLLNCISINMIISLSIIYSKNLLFYKSINKVCCKPFILTKRINGQTKASYLLFQSIVYFQLHEILLFPDVSVICLRSPKRQWLEWVSITILIPPKTYYIVFFMASKSLCSLGKFLNSF